MQSITERRAKAPSRDHALICLKLKLRVLNLMGEKVQIKPQLLKTYAVEEQQMAGMLQPSL